MTLNRAMILKNTAGSGTGGVFVGSPRTSDATQSLLALNTGTTAGGIFRQAGGAAVNLTRTAVVFNQPNNCVGFTPPGRF